MFHTSQCLLCALIQFQISADDEQRERSKTHVSKLTEIKINFPMLHEYARIDFYPRGPKYFKFSFWVMSPLRLHHQNFRKSQFSTYSCCTEHKSSNFSSNSSHVLLWARYLSEGALVAEKIGRRHFQLFRNPLIRKYISVDLNKK